ncbi:MAG: MFS transporter [Gammaproteobacteria bacterium]|nr:MFS transporter [Gammaproteobacteria bacterium]
MTSRPPEDTDSGPSEPNPQRPGIFFTEGMFDSLENRDFRFLWVGNLGAQFAMQMQMVARGWLIYAMTNSPLMLTWTLLSFALPSFLFSLFGGVIADRLQKKRVMMVAQGLNFVATLVMATIVITGHVEFMHFIYFGLFNGTVLSLSMPSRQSVIPEIVGESALFNAMALATASMNLSRVLGPAMAGGIIALVAQGDTSSQFGVGVVYYLIAVLYLVSVLTLAMMHYKGNSVMLGKRGVFSDIREGFGYMWDSPLIRGLLLMSFVPMLFGMPIQFLMPAFNKDVLGGGPEELGLLMAANGVGALLGSLVLARLGELQHKGYWLLGISMVWAVFMALFSLTERVPVALVAVAIVGLFSSMYMAMNMSLVQLAVDQNMRGRVNSILMMSFGLMPIGVIPVGWIAEHHGIDTALAISAGLLALVTILLGLLNPAIRKINRGYKGERETS